MPQQTMNRLSGCQEDVFALDFKVIFQVYFILQYSADIPAKETMIP